MANRQVTYLMDKNMELRTEIEENGAYFEKMWREAQRREQDAREELRALVQQVVKDRTANEAANKLMQQDLDEARKAVVALSNEQSLRESVHQMELETMLANETLRQPRYEVVMKYDPDAPELMGLLNDGWRVAFEQFVEGSQKFTHFVRLERVVYDAPVDEGKKEVERDLNAKSNLTPTPTAQSDARRGEGKEKEALQAFGKLLEDTTDYAPLRKPEWVGMLTVDEVRKDIFGTEPVTAQSNGRWSDSTSTAQSDSESPVQEVYFRDNKPLTKLGDILATHIASHPISAHIKNHGVEDALDVMRTKRNEVVRDTYDALMTQWMPADRPLIGAGSLMDDSAPVVTVGAMAEVGS